MADATDDFFDELARHGAVPMLREIKATVRFDIADGEQVRSWSLVIDHGTVEVGDQRDADCVIAVEKAVFDRIASGATNAMAALLRGELCVSGDPDLVVAVQRLFPGPPSTVEHEPVTARRQEQPA